MELEIGNAFKLKTVDTVTPHAIYTFLLGMVYSGLSIPFDTLWYAILAHIVTDLYAMTIGYRVKSPNKLYEGSEDS